MVASCGPHARTAFLPPLYFVQLFVGIMYEKAEHFLLDSIKIPWFTKPALSEFTWIEYKKFAFMKSLFSTKHFGTTLGRKILRDISSQKRVNLGLEGR